MTAAGSVWDDGGGAAGGGAARGGATGRGAAGGTVQGGAREDDLREDDLREGGVREGGAAGRVGALVRFNVVLRLRDPGQFVSFLIMPMVMMSALNPIYDRAVGGGAEQVTTGMLVIFSALALSIVGNAVLVERSWHTWDRLRATRAGLAELVIGKALPVYALLLLQQVILLGYGVTVTGASPRGPAAWALLAPAVLVWSGFLLAVGIAVAAVVRSHGELSATSEIGAVLLTTLGGAFVPLALMPGWLQAIAPASPGYWAMELLRAALDGSAAAMLRPGLILLTLTLAAAALAGHRLSRGWGRSTTL